MNWNMFPTLRRRSMLPELSPMETIFRDFFDETRLPMFFENRLPRADFAETDKEFLINVELPGMDEKDVEVRLNGNQLVVKGERKQKKEDKDKYFHRVETTYGAFERRFELPQEVAREPDKLVATFHNGMLEIKVPKVEKATLKIPVKAA